LKAECPEDDKIILILRWILLNLGVFLVKLKLYFVILLKIITSSECLITREEVKVHFFTLFVSHKPQKMQFYVQSQLFKSIAFYEKDRGYNTWIV
jgi:hypothetical protein